MTRLRLPHLCLAFLLASATLLAAAPEAETPRTFPSGVEVITVDAVVLGKDGMPVPGLTADDFRVTEDDVPQTISSFEAVVLRDREERPFWSASAISTNVVTDMAPPSRSFVIVFDDVHISALTEGRARTAVDEFLLKGLRPGDEVTIVPTSGGSWWSGRLPEDREDLRAFAARLKAKKPLRNPMAMSDYEAQRIHVYRDEKLGAEVIRRYIEQGLAPDYGGDLERMKYIKELGIGNDHTILRAEALSLYTAAVDRAKVTLKTLARVMASLTETKGRKAVILVSEGFFNEPQITDFRDTLEAARRANAVLYFIDARDEGVMPAQSSADVGQPIQAYDIEGFLGRWRLDGAGSDTLAVGSGGFSFRNANDLLGGMQRIAEESRAYYLIGYQSGNTRRDGKYRKIHVDTTRPDLKVRARQGYYAQQEGGRTAQAEAGELDPRLRGALDSPRDRNAIPLRMTTYVFGPAGTGKANVLVTADVNPAALSFADEQGRLVAALETFTLITARETGAQVPTERRLDLSLPPEARAQVFASWLPLYREFELTPGTYQARLLVREAKTGKIGTVRHVFSVPPATEFRVTSPVLSDTLRPPAAPGAAPQPLPLARRTFKSGATIVCLLEILGATRDAAGLTHVSLGYGVRRVGSEAFTRVPLRPFAPDAEGRYIPHIPIALAGATPGDYQLVLTVSDDVAGKTLDVREDFVVE
jgi:VWFA-related protein